MMDFYSFEMYKTKNEAISSVLLMWPTEDCVQPAALCSERTSIQCTLSKVRTGYCFIVQYHKSQIKNLPRGALRSALRPSIHQEPNPKTRQTWNTVLALQVWNIFWQPSAACLHLCEWKL